MITHLHVKKPGSLSLVFLLLATFACGQVAIPTLGELTTGDFLATDSTGKDFHYDIFTISNPTGSPVDFELTLEAGAGLRPWLALWSTPVLPAADWESPTDLYSAALVLDGSSTLGDTVVLTGLTLPALSAFQIGVATSDYNQDGATLDTYALSADSFELVIAAVPEPGAWALLASLPILAFAALRRR